MCNYSALDSGRATSSSGLRSAATPSDAGQNGTHGLVMSAQLEARRKLCLAHAPLDGAHRLLGLALAPVQDEPAPLDEGLRDEGLRDAIPL